MDIRDIINLILSGQPLNEALDSLLESVTPFHEDIGAIKEALRRIKPLRDGNFAHQFNSPPTENQRKRLEKVIEHFDRHFSFWTSIRAPKLIKGDPSFDEVKAYSDMTMDLLELMNNTNLSIRVLRPMMRVVDRTSALVTKLKEQG